MEEIAMVKRNEKTSNIVDQKALVNEKVKEAKENNFKGDHIRRTDTQQ